MVTFIATLVAINYVIFIPGVLGVCTYDCMTSLAKRIQPATHKLTQQPDYSQLCTDKSAILAEIDSCKQSVEAVCTGPEISSLGPSIDMSKQILHKSTSIYCGSGNNSGNCISVFISCAKRFPTLLNNPYSSDIDIQDKLCRQASLDEFDANKQCLMSNATCLNDTEIKSAIEGITSIKQACACGGQQLFYDEEKCNIYARGFKNVSWTPGGNYTATEVDCRMMGQFTGCINDILKTCPLLVNYFESSIQGDIKGEIMRQCNLQFTATNQGNTLCLPMFLLSITLIMNYGI